MTAPRPGCAIAFKEWAGVCDAIATGRQTILLRKGGIAEGPAGFEPEHDTFWLYPTHLHEGQQGLRFEADPRIGMPDRHVPIDVLCRVASIHYLEREDRLGALMPFHVWTEETIRSRFSYRRPGLWLLGIRAYRRPGPHLVRVTPEQAGCRTWVELEAPLAADDAAPVLETEDFERRMGEFRAAISG